MITHLPHPSMTLPKVLVTLIAVNFIIVSAQVPTDGLVAEYIFDGNASDTSGSGNDGTVYGATLTTDRFGNPDSAYSFDGNNDYIWIGDKLKLETFTISLWIKLSTSPRVKIIRWRMHGYLIYTDDITGIICAGTYNYLTELSKTCSTGSYTDDSWHHIVFTRDQSYCRLYVDNGIVGSEQASGATDFGSGGLAFGRDGNYNGEYVDGLLDDIRFYNRALSETEIQYLYHESEFAWIIPPTDQSIEHCESLSFTVEVSSVSGPVIYAVDDDVKFTIDASGTLTNKTVLALGPHVVQVSANDTTNVIFETITITVQNSAPVWAVTPVDQNVIYDRVFSYSVLASDPSNCDQITYAVSDTVNFKINTNDLLTNNTTLALGTYTIQISASDGTNVIYATITINVILTPEDPKDILMIVLYVGSGICAMLIFVFVVLIARKKNWCKKHTLSKDRFSSELYEIRTQPSAPPIEKMPPDDTPLKPPPEYTPSKNLYEDSHEYRPSKHEEHKKRDRSPSKSSKECTICLENKPDTALLPCGHATFCHGCAAKLMGEDSPCPICRGKITGINRIYT